MGGLTGTLLGVLIALLVVEELLEHLLLALGGLQLSGDDGTTGGLHVLALGLGLKRGQLRLHIGENQETQPIRVD